MTVRGFVASEIRTSTTPGGTSTASFRLGSTGRPYCRNTNSWVDGNTNWFTVQSFRQLAGHAACSLKKGQRVIVVGKLKLRQWEHEGKIYHDTEIDAESIGHDLMWGTANFLRMTSNNLQGRKTTDSAESNVWAGGDHPGAPLEGEAPEAEGEIDPDADEATLRLVPDDLVPDDAEGEDLLVDTQ